MMRGSLSCPWFLIALLQATVHGYMYYATLQYFGETLSRRNA